MVHGRSPLGRLRSLRAAVLGTPLLALAALTPLLMGPGRTGPALNPESHAELAPYVGPLLGAAVLLAAAVRATLGPRSSKPLRVLAICVTYTLAMIAALAGLFFWLAGASPGWAVAGYAAVVAAVALVSLGRYAHDVSARY